MKEFYEHFRAAKKDFHTAMCLTLLPFPRTRPSPLLAAKVALLKEKIRRQGFAGETPIHDWQETVGREQQELMAIELGL